MRHYATLFDRNYLVKGLCLYHSMEKYAGDFCLHILALDGSTARLLSQQDLPHATITPLAMLLENSAHKDAIQLAQANRTWQEFCWTMGSVWLRDCVERYGVSTYLDADAWFMSDPEPVYAEIGDAVAAVTPHRYTPGHEGGYANGIYNVNFVYVTPQGLPFATEWADLCLDWCFYRHSEGRFADQKYLDQLVPKHGVHVIRHVGVNLAPWNQKQYAYSLRDGQLLVEDVPAILYHMHEFDGRVGKLTGWALHDMVRDHIYPSYVETYREIEELL